jgi:nitrate reductase delta subunit
MSPYVLLALLLQYPDEEIMQARGEIVTATRELQELCVQDRALDGFLGWWAASPPYVLQATYVETFDLGRRCALHLTYPLFGDRRERGMALLRLKHRFATHGLSLRDGELPDFLPVMLEYADADPDGVALLIEHRVPLELLRAALGEAQSPYAAVVEAVCGLLGELTDTELVQVQRIAAEGPPMETVGLQPFAPPDVMPETAGEGMRR